MISLDSWLTEELPVSSGGGGGVSSKERRDKSLSCWLSASTSLPPVTSEERKYTLLPLYWVTLTPTSYIRRDIDSKFAFLWDFPAIIRLMTCLEVCLVCVVTAWLSEGSRVLCAWSASPGWGWWRTGPVERPRVSPVLQCGPAVVASTDTWPTQDTLYTELVLNITGPIGYQPI